ncbi:toll-like receptor e [Plakobranchus ocellatus]|uniref:Toll-like receptor e n=1 Tax=Plakobranchus ocellatus TaxID=259542 RepID=A0AAV4C2F9_9GAST|nr:toll-like receptor e [Plakobranchus ocellatus]
MTTPRKPMRTSMLILLLHIFNVEPAVSIQETPSKVERMNIPGLEGHGLIEGNLFNWEKHFQNKNKVYDTINPVREGHQTYDKAQHSENFDETFCSRCEETNMFHESFMRKHEGENMQVIDAHMSVSRALDSYGCCKIYNTFANCSYCGLYSIPSNLPANITALWLAHNNINDDVLQPGVFSHYSNLKILSLSTNNITSLPDGVFQGLRHLQCLCLQNNFIKMDQSLNSSFAFEAFNESLVFLKLNRNNKNLLDDSLIYPTFALSFLKNLKYLYLDGIPFKRFENPDQQFRKLTHLTLAGFNEGYCNITGLYENAFELDALIYLDISDCAIEGRFVNKSAFENLKDLQTLVISNNFNLGIATVGEFMYGFRNNTNFENLVMERINPRFTPCIAIYNYTLRHFKNTGLKRIYAMDNEIEIIEKGALQNLPETLTFLNLTGNKIIFGDYIQDLATLTGLEILILDGSLKSYRFPYKYPSVDLNSCGEKNNNQLETANEEKHIERVSRDQDIKYIPIPPRLYKLQMERDGMVYTLDNITFSSNNLTEANLKGNFFQYLDGPIYGFDKLKNLNLRQCHIYKISGQFFNHFSHLEKLDLSDNYLSQNLYEDTNGDIFKNLRSITNLNLHLNNIFTLTSRVFENLDKMKHLDLSQNRLGEVAFSIAHMKQLEVINLTGNEIRSLSRETMKEIDLINKERIQLKLDLGYNPIGCDCDNRRFLEWFTESGVMWKNISYRYLCDTELQPDDFEGVIERLRQKCDTHHTIFAIVTCATVVIILIILASLVYRFRWTLRYWYHAAKLTMLQSLPDDQFEHDVFVSYSIKDDFVEEVLIPCLQNDFNLRVHLHGLHFSAGGQITDSIYRAVTTSRKTLVVITKNMLGSYWCNYELMMARREAITRGRQVLVFLFLEPMSSWEVSSDIASYVRESTYIAYPPDTAHREAFWNKLASDLGADVSLI